LDKKALHYYRAQTLVYEDTAKAKADHQRKAQEAAQKAAARAPSRGRR
jgi:hypothetical protein